MIQLMNRLVQYINIESKAFSNNIQTPKDKDSDIKDLIKHYFGQALYTLRGIGICPQVLVVV
jgi:hypothetical protein